jgi:uncharacterized protein (TIGR03382 family)
MAAGPMWADACATRALGGPSETCGAPFDDGGTESGSSSGEAPADGTGDDVGGSSGDDEPADGSTSVDEPASSSGDDGAGDHDPPASGCGCDASGEPSAPLVLLAFLLRRRRQPGTTQSPTFSYSGTGSV